jgi:hypothetical protein
MARAADHDVLTVSISAATAAFILFTQRNPLWMLAAGTIAGLASVHSGWPG